MSLSAMIKPNLYRRYARDYSEDKGAEEVLRQTERHLEEQHRVVAAADQRAIAFAAVLMVVTGLLLEDKAGTRVAQSRLWVIGLYIFSVALSIFSARPARIFGSGSDGALLAEYVEPRMSGYLISALIDRNDRNIMSNRRAITVSTWTFRLALLIALIATLVLYLDWAI